MGSAPLVENCAWPGASGFDVRYSHHLLRPRIGHICSRLTRQGEIIEWEMSSGNLVLVLVGLFLCLRFIVVVKKVHRDSPPGVDKLKRRFVAKDDSKVPTTCQA